MAMIGAPPALPPRPPGGVPPAGVPFRVAPDLPPAGQRRKTPAAGVAADINYGPMGKDRPDHLWSVLHHREDSQPPNRPGRPRSREDHAAGRESRSLPSRPDEVEQLPPLQAPFPYQAPLPPIGWGGGAPIGAVEADWRADLKAAHLRPRMNLELGGESREWMEKRLEVAITEQRSEISRRFAGFEQADKHFKDWVQREHEQLHAQLQQVRSAGQESGQQQQRLVGALTAQNQKQDMRLQELEAGLAQAAAQMQGVMNAVSTGVLSAAGGNGGGTGEAAMGAAAVAASASANLEVLRAGLEREASARVALGVETAEQLKQLNDMVQELGSRQQQQAVAAHQKLQQNVAQDEQEAQRYEARFSSLEPSVQQLKEELEQMREQLNRSGTECSRRCEEAEEMCNKRLHGVQEAALSAARELWEEHQGVVAECKASLAALQQILDSKDKIAAQLRSLQQQQREEDKHEFWTQFQMRHEHLQAKLGDAERALVAEQNARIEEQQRAEGIVSRLGLALEKAQASWIKESAKLSDQIHEAKRDFSIDLDGETKGVARRLSDGLEAAQRQIDDLDRKILAAQTNLNAVSERVDSSARAQNTELRDSEGRVMRQVSDVQTIQTGKTAQAVFDMKAELAKLDQVVASQVSSLRQAQEEMEARAMAAVSSLDARTSQRLQDALDYERERGRQEQVRLLEEERSLRLRAEAERVSSLQKRLKAHEDQVSTHFEGLKREQIVTMTQLRERVDEAKRELLEDVHTAEDRLVRRLDEQLELERNKTREQIEAFIEEERSERIKAEAERLGSLQKRLQAHEDLTTQRLAEHRQRTEAEAGTLRRGLEAQALQDKQDLQKDFHDFAQEQRQAMGSLTEDVNNLAGDCMRINESLEALQRSTDQRLAAEGAALAAQLSVASAGLTASQQRATEALNEALKNQKMQLQDDVAKVSEELDKMNGEILKLIDDESNKVKDGHAAIESRIQTLEMAFTARTQTLGDVDAQLSARLDEVAASSQEAMENLRDALAAETGKLVERFGQVQDDVQSIEAEVLRRCEDMGEAQAEAKLAQDEMFGNLQANIGDLGAKIEESRAAEGDLQKQVTAAQEGLVAADTRASALEELLAQESTRASTAEESLSRTAEGLAAQQAKQGGEQLAFAEKLKDLTQQMADKFQAQQEAAEAQQAKLEAQLEKEQKTAQDSQEKLKEAIDEARKAAEAQVKEEHGRATEAETALREGLAAQASQAAAQAAAQAQAQAAAADESVRQTRAVEELRKQLQTTDEECNKVQAATAEEAARQTRDVEELRKQIQSADEECKKALAASEERAQAATKAVQDSVAEAQKASSALAEKVDSVKKQAEEAQAEAAVAQESVTRAAASSEAEKKAADKTLEEELEKLRKTSEEALAAEQQRALAAEKALQDSLEEAQKSSVSLAEKVEAAQTKAEAAEAEAAIAQESLSHAAASSEAEKKAAGKSLEDELAKLRKESEEEIGKLREQLRKMEETDKQAATAASEKEAEAKKEKEKELDQQKVDLEELRKRLADAEAKDETLKKEANDAKELQEKALQEMRQRLEELSRLSDAAAKGEEAATRCLKDVEALQSKLEEEVGAVRLRVDGGFRALLQRSEAEKWLRENVDTVADGVSNAFLRLLDKSSEKLSFRVEKLEKTMGGE